jgi:predicted small lipoprotein YifL
LFSGLLQQIWQLGDIGDAASTSGSLAIFNQAGKSGAGLICNPLTFALIGAALALSACGRAGPLEPPPGPAMVPASSTQLVQPDIPPQEMAAKTGFDTHGNPVAAPGHERPFFIPAQRELEEAEPRSAGGSSE